MESLSESDKLYDKDFRQQMRSNTEQLLSSEEKESGLKIKAHTNTKNTIYVVIPQHTEKIRSISLAGLIAAGSTGNPYVSPRGQHSPKYVSYHHFNWHHPIVPK